MPRKYLELIPFVLILAIALYIFYQTNFFILDDIFLGAVTFIFATILGFFVVRHMDRYAKIRENLANFDAHVENIHSTALNIDADMAANLREAIIEEYKGIISTSNWTAGLLESGNAFIHLLSQIVHHQMRFKHDDGNLIDQMSLRSIIDSISSLQVIRKEILLLEEERMTLLQKTLVITLTIMMVIVLAAVPTAGLFIPSVIKATSVTAVGMATWILFQLEHLKLFEDNVGDRTAHDLLDTLQSV